MSLEANYSIFFYLLSDYIAASFPLLQSVKDSLYFDFGLGSSGTVSLVNEVKIINMRQITDLYKKPRPLHPASAAFSLFF